MENQNTEVIELKNLDKLPESTTAEMLKLYNSSQSMETYAKLSFGLIAILVLIHNVFIAGNSYPIDTYDTIMNVELSIVGIIVLGVFIIAGIALSKTSQLKGDIRENCERYHIKNEDLAKEFSMLAVHLYGGNGVKVK